jgi:arylsulfatase A
MGTMPTMYRNLLAALAALGAGLAFAKAADQPNILILYADDLGYGDLGCYNSDSKIPTPNLDALAATGLRFTDGHSSSGICTPSRYALLTGRHHWRKFHGIVNAFGASAFDAERLTMPEMLREKGYATAAIGKWHLGWDWAAIRKPDAQQAGEGRRKFWGPEAFDWSQSIPDGPLAHGFDHYFGDTVINFPPYCWIEDDRVTAVPDRIMDTELFKPIKEGNWEFRPGPMITGWDPYTNIPTTTQRGIEYIHAQAETDEPFFLYFAWPSPHAPIIPNDEFDGASAAGPYGDFVTETDASAGQLLKALEESGQADNTIVVFSADNGPEKYAYARDANFDHWSAYPLRGLKRDIYEGGHRVPFLIRWPGVTEAGATNESLVSQIDLMATFADALEFELPSDQAHDSHTLLPLLKGEVDGIRDTHIHNTYEGQWAIRHGDWVLVDHKDGYRSGRVADWETKRQYPADDDQPAELYNLAKDLEQRHNLASQYPERVENLRKRMAEIRDRGHSAPRLAGD